MRKSWEIVKCSNIKDEINKTIRLDTALAVFLTAVLDISIVLDKASTMSIICTSLILLYNVADIVLLCVTKQRVKSNIQFDYRLDGKEELTRVYKDTRTLSICNNAILIIEMSSLVVYEMVAMKFAFSITAALMGSVGTRAIVILIRK